MNSKPEIRNPKLWFWLCLLTSAFCLLAVATPTARRPGIAGTYDRPVPASGAGGGGLPCSPSYASKGGMGDREAHGPNGTIIWVTAAGVAPSMQGSGGSAESAWVNGDTTSAGQGFFTGGAVSSSSWVQFDFGSGHAVLITEAKYYQQNSASQGTWKWQGSNDASTWTDVGSSFNLGGIATQTITTLSGNTTEYRYYRLLGVSGTSSSSPWAYEMEFKICGL